MDQHFMVDEKALERIVSAAGLKKNETVLEIGAGTGLLTERLAKMAGKVIAIEMDEKLAKELEKRFASSNVLVISGNALEKMKGLSFDKIASNIPYSISEALIQEMIFHSFKCAVLTVPKGFYYRLVGGSKLGIFAGLFFKVELIGDVPKNAFSPRPKTSSVLIKVELKRLTGNKKVLKELFLQRDKKIKNALLEAFCKVEKLTRNQARERLKKLGNNNLLEKRLSVLNADELKILVNKQLHNK